MKQNVLQRWEQLGGSHSTQLYNGRSVDMTAEDVAMREQEADSQM